MKKSLIIISVIGILGYVFRHAIGGFFFILFLVMADIADNEVIKSAKSPDGKYAVEVSCSGGFIYGSGSYEIDLEDTEKAFFLHNSLKIKGLVSDDGGCGDYHFLWEKDTLSIIVTGSEQENDTTKVDLKRFRKMNKSDNYN